MKYRFKLGEKVRILWHKSRYTATPNHMDTGEVRSNLTAPDGTPYVEVYKFHKIDKYMYLYFPIAAIRSLVVDAKDGDAL